MFSESRERPTIQGEPAERGDFRPVRSAWESGIGLAAIVLASALLTLALWRAYTPAVIFPDSVQQISVAENVLDAKGLLTSVLRYPEHYTFKTVPAPQTVWPPALGVATAGLSALGLSTTQALAVITFASLFLLPLAMYVGLRYLRASPVFAFACSTLLLTLPSFWTYTLRLMSETPFAFVTLLSLVFFAASFQRRLSLLAFAGLFAGLAFSIRYAGLFYIAATGLVLVCQVLIERNRPALQRMFVYAIASGLPVIVLFTRNLLLREKLSGGQFDAAEPIGLPQALIGFFWTCKNVVTAWLGAGTPEWLSKAIVLASTVLFGGLVCHALYRFVRIPAARQEASTVALLACAVYALLTAAVHIWSAATQAGWFLTEPRYFVVLIPTTVFGLALYVSHIAYRSSLGHFGSRPWRYGIAILAIIALALQVSFAFDESVRRDHGGSMRYVAVTDALALRLGSGQTVAEFLQKNVREERAILTPNPETLYLLSKIGSVGLTEKRFGPESWAGARVARLLCELPIDYVLVIRSELSGGRFRDPNLFQQILQGSIPQYLDPINEDEDVRLLSVNRSRLQAATDGLHCHA